MKAEDKAKAALALSLGSVFCCFLTAIPAMLLGQSAMKELSKDSPQHGRAKLSIVIAAVTTGLWSLLIVITAMVAPQSTPRTERPPTPKVRQDEGLGAKPQQSAWDGSVPEVQEYLRRNMKDFESLKIHEASPVKETTYGGTKYWGIRYRWSGTNALGARIQSNQLFLIRGGKVIKVIDSNK